MTTDSFSGSVIYVPGGKWMCMCVCLLLWGASAPACACLGGLRLKLRSLPLSLSTLTEEGFLSSTQSSLILLLYLASFSKDPLLVFYLPGAGIQVTTPTWPLPGFWRPELYSLPLLWTLHHSNRQLLNRIRGTRRHNAFKCLKENNQPKIQDLMEIS